VAGSASSYTVPTGVPSNAAANRIDLRGARGGSFVPAANGTYTFYGAHTTSATPGLLCDEDGDALDSMTVVAGRVYPLPIDESFGVPYLFVSGAAASTVSIYMK